MLKIIISFLVLFLITGGSSMASQVLIIKSETAKDGFQYVGDVIGVYSDTDTFTEDELANFNVLTIGGTVEEVQLRLDQLSPTIADVVELTNGAFVFQERYTGTGDDIVDRFVAFQVGIRWYKLVSDFQFPINVDGLTAEEKQLLETLNINHPSVDSAINKIVKDYTALPGNDVEIKDLKNQEPYDD